MIRPILKKEIPQLVNLHLKLLPNSLEAKLGKDFVELFYRSLISEAEFFCDGFFWNHQLVGFVVYSLCPKKVFRCVVQKRLISWARILIRVC